MLEKLKKEIRAILISAMQTGRTPEKLEQDFRDMNGRAIPVKALGYADIYELLDAIPDVIEAYEVNGEVILFAKSCEKTAHLEHLVAKAKPSKLGRFGGVIQQPAVCRRGTPERRELIKKRLIEITSQSPDYITYFDLFNHYQSKYYEVLDAKGDFGCQPKAIFTIKLANLFDVKGGGAASGHFMVRLKDSARKTTATSKNENINGLTNGGSSSMNILGANGFGQQQRVATSPVVSAVNQSVDKANKGECAALTVTTTASATAPKGPFSIRPEDLFRSSVVPSQGYATAHPFIPPPVPMAGMRGPYGNVQFTGQSLHHIPAQQLVQPMMPSYPRLPQQQQPPPMMFAQVHHGGHPFVGPPAHQFMFAAPTFSCGPGPFMHPLQHQQQQLPPITTTAMIDNRMEILYENGNPVAMRPIFYPGLPAMMMQQQPQQQQMIINEQLQQFQNRPEAGAGGDNGTMMIATWSLDVNAAPFEPKSEIELKSEVEEEEKEIIGQAPKVPSLPPASECFLEESDIVSTRRSIISQQTPTPLQQQEPVSSTAAAIDAANRSQVISERDQSPSPTKHLERRLDLDRQGIESWLAEAVATVNTDAASHRDVVVENIEANAATTSDEQVNRCLRILIEECKQVLNRFPAGIPYLEFGKAYREVLGKEMNLEPCNLLSVNELVEDFGPDLFISHKTEKGVLLFDKESFDHFMTRAKIPTAAIAPAAIASTSTAAANAPKRTNAVEQWAEAAGEDALVAALWRIAMNLPSRTLFIQQIPHVYLQETGATFPFTGVDLDEFAMKLFDYTDRFEFQYEGGLRVIALPQYDDAPIDDISSSNTTRNLDYIQFGEAYQKQALAVTADQLRTLDESHPSRFFDVLLAQVETPGRFFVHMKSMYDRLIELINEMNDHYGLSSNGIVIPSTALKVNMACACLYDEDELRYRGLVLNIRNNEVEVLLVDYGTEIQVRIESVYYLTRRFFLLPMQAIECKMAVLSPPDGQNWPFEAGDLMVQTAESTVLSAEIYHIEDDVLHVFLTKHTEDGGEIYLSDVLLEAQLAVFDDSSLAQVTTNGLTVNELDLEDEIASITGDDDLPTTNDDAFDMAELQRAINAIPEIDLAFEENMIDQITKCELKNESDFEVVIMAKAIMCSKRLALTKKLSEGNGDFGPIIVDKLTWLEEQLRWLEEIEGIITNGTSS